MTDDEYEILIRKLYVSHKRTLIAEKFLYAVFGVVVIFILSFAGAIVSMIVTMIK